MRSNPVSFPVWMRFTTYVIVGIVVTITLFIFIALHAPHDSKEGIGAKASVLRGANIRVVENIQPIEIQASHVGVEDVQDIARTHHIDHFSAPADANDFDNATENKIDFHSLELNSSIITIVATSPPSATILEKLLPPPTIVDVVPVSTARPSVERSIPENDITTTQISTIAPTQPPKPLYYRGLKVVKSVQQDNTNVFPLLSTIQNMYINSLIEYSLEAGFEDISVTGSYIEPSTTGSDRHVQHQVVETFHHTYQQGEYCKNRQLDDSTGSTLLGAVVDYVESGDPSAFLDINSKAGPSTLSLIVSRMFENITVVSITYNGDESSPQDDLIGNSELLRRRKLGAVSSSSSPSSSLAEHVKQALANPQPQPCEDLSQPSNLYVSQPMSAMNERWIAPSQGTYWNCVQAVDDLSVLVGSRLPQEFEEHLGALLCRCNDTFLPKDLPDTPYFQYWRSLSSLMHGVVAVQRVLLGPGVQKCQLGLLSSDSALPSYGTKVKYTHAIVHRNISDDYRAAAPLSGTAALTVQDLLSLGVTTASLQSILSSVANHDFLQSWMPGHNQEALSAMSLLFMQGSFAYGAQELQLPRSDDIFSTVMLATRKQLRAQSTLGHSAPSAGPGDKSLDSMMSAIHVVESDSRVGNESDVLADRRELLDLNSSANTVDIFHFIQSNTTSYSHVLVDSNEPNITTEAVHVVNRNVTVPQSLRRRLSALYSDNTPYQASDSASVNHATEWELPGLHDMHSDALDVGRDPLGAWGGEIDVQTKKAKKKSVTDSSSMYTSSTGNSKKGLVIDDSYRKKIRALQQNEDAHYQRWLTLLRSDGKQFKALKHSKLVYFIGRHTTLLSVKLAEAFLHFSTLPQVPGSGADSVGLVVSWLTNSGLTDTHLRLAQLVGTDNNNIVCNAKITFPVLAALAAAPERPDVAVIQSDVVISALVLALSTDRDNSRDAHSQPPASEEDLIVACGANLFEEVMALYMTLASTVYIEIPDEQHLAQLIEITLRQLGSDAKTCAQFLTTRYSLQTTDSCKMLDLLGEEVVDWTCMHSGNILARSSERLAGTSSHRLEISELTSNFNNSGNCVYNSSTSHHNCSGSTRVFKVQVEASLINSYKSAFNQPNNAWKLRSSTKGVSLYTLLHMGIAARSVQKKQLFQMFIDLPLWSLDSREAMDQVQPWRVFVQCDRLNRLKQSRVLSSRLMLRYFADSPAQDTSSLIGVSSVDVPSASAAASSTSSSISSSEMIADRRRSRILWAGVQQELHFHSAETTGGRFSFVEHNSGYGYFSSLLAGYYPNATVISVERDASKVSHHAKMVKSLGLQNNAVCNKDSEDATIFKNIYESPELFRFQMISRGLLDTFAASSSSGLEDWGQNVGMMLSSALTSFVAVPSAEQISLAMHVFYGGVGGTGIYRDSSGPYRPLSHLHDRTVSTSGLLPEDDLLKLNLRLEKLLGMNSMAAHPISQFENFETLWLLGFAKLKIGFTELSLTPIFKQSIQNKNQATDKLMRLPLIRCDITNMTRHVHHHYDYARDGHTRTYTMRVQVNHTLTEEVKLSLGGKDPSLTISSQLREGVLLTTDKSVDNEPPRINYNLPSDTSNNNNIISNNNSDNRHVEVLLPPGTHANQHNIVQVQLFRDRDSFPIPYTSIHGITLITTLRLGLNSAQRDTLFEKFLNLSMYEDMAPWNIVLMGPTVDYIDYDTKDITFNLDIPKAYQVMTVLMNYKRTVEDFKKCGSKASTVYGLPYVSDCVGTNDKSNLVCSDLKYAVPCGDGVCHSDYISCLRSLTNIATALAAAASSEDETGQGRSIPGTGRAALSIAERMQQQISSGIFDSRGFHTSEKLKS